MREDCETQMRTSICRRTPAGIENARASEVTVRSNDGMFHGQNDDRAHDRRETSSSNAPDTTKTDELSSCGLRSVKTGRSFWTIVKRLG
jgi:hypothetical protein